MENGGVGEWSFGVFPDMATQFALQDGFEKSADFLLFAGGEKFDPAVAQIPDGAGHVETLGYVPDRVTETDSLDVAFVKDLNGCFHAIPRFIRRRGNCQRDLRVRRRLRQIGVGQLLGWRNQPRVVRIQIELFHRR